MRMALEKYLDRVMIIANRNEAESPDIRAELKDHLLKKIEELQADGLKHEDAIFQAIEDHGNPQTVGYSLRPRFPWLDVRTKGTARGFIAIGPKAVGVVAIGGAACGVLAYGGFAVGLLSFGGFALALVVALGGITFAPIGLAYGGIAVGLMAVGGLALGIAAMGGLAVGMLCLNDHCGKMISYFTAETAPDYIQSISDIMNGLFGVIVIGFWISCIVLLAVQLSLSRKEHQRIKNADPSLIE